MKAIITFLLVAFSTAVFAQFNSAAPWLNNTDAAKQETFTINELKNLFDSYWLTHDKNKKGSGYKPFMRWHYHWKNKTNNQGYLITPDAMWNALSQKNAFKSINSIQSFATSNWEAVGPFSHTNTGSWSSGQGRVNIVHVDPSNANNVYIGTPAGGIWKSTNAGNGWIPLSDNLPQIGVSGIAIDYSNSNVIYIATGDKDAADTYSIGVLKSVDGGATWSTTGLTFSNTSTRAGDILIHPTNNQILWCATSVGLYRTTNAGATWQMVRSGNFSQGSIRLKPNNPSIVYAVSNTRFFVSTNTGANFTQVTTGLPTNSGRLILDVTPANAEYVYILSAQTDYSLQGLFKSTNGGSSFTNVSGTGTNIFESSQAWFDLALAVSNTNAEEVYTGCLNVWKSVDGGFNFTKINSWSQPFQASYTHADIHYLGFQGNLLYCGSDGGIYVSNNGGMVFNDKTAGAQIGQFYKISVSKQTSGKMVGGLQDNGGQGLSNAVWKNFYGADGMDTAISPTNSNLYYGFIQNGSNLYISTNAANSLGTNVSIPSGASGNWVTPLAINEAGQVFSAYNNLYRLNGSTWVQQNTTSLGTDPLELLSIDPSNDNIMYVSNDIALYKSLDKGITFTLIYTAPSEITAIDVHSSNSAIVYIATSGINGLVLKSIDGGQTFTDFSTGLPTIAKNTIVHQGRNTTNPVYVGTSLGVYYIDDTLTSWQPFDTNLPNVAVTDLEINLEDSKLIAATYGRGIWQTNIPVQIPDTDIKLVEIQSPNNTLSCSGSVTPQIKIKNNGLNSVSNINFNYEIDGVVFNYTWTGSLLSNTEQNISLPTTNLSRGAHLLKVNATTTNDAYLDNNSNETFFNSNDAGIVNQVNTFSNASDALIVYGEGNSNNWTRGIRSSGLLNSGGSVVYATNLSGNYANNTKTYLVSQCYDLTSLANPQIQFSMKFDLEQNWDLVYVEYSTNFGQTWSVLGEANASWYNSDRTPQTTGTDCNNCVGAQWTGTNTTATNYNYPLNNLANQQNVIFRIVFHSDTAITRLGATVDNFVINGVLSQETFQLDQILVYPNPSNGIFSIYLGELKPSVIEVFDVSGKLILTKKDITVYNSESVLDLTNASTGIYFVRIIENNKQIVKRISKQ